MKRNLLLASHQTHSRRYLDWTRFAVDASELNLLKQLQRREGPWTEQHLGTRSNASVKDQKQLTVNKENCNAIREEKELRYMSQTFAIIFALLPSLSVSLPAEQIMFLSFSIFSSCSLCSGKYTESVFSSYM